MQRELLLLVYLENKYGKDGTTTSTLRRMVGYKGSGGVYSAISGLRNAGFVEEGKGILIPTLKGEKYVKDNFLYTFDIIGMFGFLLIFVGLLFAFQSAMEIFLQIDIEFTSPIPAVVFIAAGIFLRYGFLRFYYRLRQKS